MTIIQKYIYISFETNSQNIREKVYIIYITKTMKWIWINLWKLLRVYNKSRKWNNLQKIQWNFEHNLYLCKENVFYLKSCNEYFKTTSPLDTSCKGSLITWGTGLSPHFSYMDWILTSTLPRNSEATEKNKKHITQYRYYLIWSRKNECY